MQPLYPNHIVRGPAQPSTLQGGLSRPQFSGQGWGQMPDPALGQSDSLCLKNGIRTRRLLEVTGCLKGADEAM